MSQTASEIAESESSAVSDGAKDSYTASDESGDLARCLVGDSGDTSSVKIAHGSDGDDSIAITSGKDGAIVVTVNGEATTYTAKEAKQLVIDGGSGNDKITVDKAVMQALNIAGGQGDDVIIGGSGNDRIMDNYGRNYIQSGAGNDTVGAGGLDYEAGSDSGVPAYAQGKSPYANGVAQGNYIDGGEGNDYIEGGRAADNINAGVGDDVVYGMSGDDVIVAGAGLDYVDGGKGQDKISGGFGNDMIMGGDGGDDVIVGGRGADTVNAGAGTDEVTVDTDDGTNVANSETLNKIDSIAIPTNVFVSGNEQYRERVECDLAALAANAVGQTMLNGIGDTDKQVEIVSTVGGNKASYNGNGVANADGTPNVGSNSKDYYNTSRIATGGNYAWSARPPIVGLYHEMGHSYNAVTGTLISTQYDYDGNVVEKGVKGCEFQTMGVDNGKVPANPEGITENALRDFLNLPTRERY